MCRAFCFARTYAALRHFYAPLVPRAALHIPCKAPGYGIWKESWSILLATLDRRAMRCKYQRIETSKQGETVSIEELAALDAQYRETVRRNAIRETQRGIAIRAAQSADTSKLERQLDRLRFAGRAA